MIDTGYWILDAGCWILDTGCWMLDAGCWLTCFRLASPIPLESGRTCNPQLDGPLFRRAAGLNAYSLSNDMRIADLPEMIPVNQCH